MHQNFKGIFIPLGPTLLALFFFELIASSLFPALGIQVRPTFHVLLVIFLALYVDSPFVPVYVFIIQWVHGLFSVEGWSFGLFSAIILVLVIGQLKDWLNFSSHFLTILTTQVLQFLWFYGTCFLLSTKLGHWGYFTGGLTSFLVGSAMLSLFSPYFFSILKRVWMVDFDEGVAG